MWHEARRREKATQKLLNEHKKRAEKRREENKVDPNSFLQVHGIKAKICLDPNVYKQAANSLVAWQGDKSIMIDRFDVRATLTSIPTSSSAHSSNQKPKASTVLDAEEYEPVKKLLNYERYRLLVQNDLNKVPEELRLKLVSKSELVTSDAKLRKLRYNKFGTSGDASISQANQFAQNTKVSQARDTGARRGAAIGYCYNSVPPPSSLLDEDRISSRNCSQNEESSLENHRAEAPEILDLDDFPESGDLDTVSISRFDRKRINEISSKYSLTNEEFEFILKRDTSEVPAGDILKEVRKFLSRNKDKTVNDSQSGSLTSAKELVYGPTLPPEMMMNTNHSNRLNGRTDSPSDYSSNDDSPVRQRSPNGATIPLREDAEKSPEEEESPRESSNLKHEPVDANELPVVDEPKESLSPDKKTELICTTSSNLNKDRHLDRRSRSTLSSSSQSDEESAEKSRRNYDRSRSRNRRKRDHQEDEPRRASTPLAYKRNRRSSRSLSRERRSNYGSSYSRTKRRDHNKSCSHRYT